MEAIVIAALAGGVGAARFLEGLVAVVDPADVVAIVNTGDDTRFHGLHVAPDLDIVMYTLAGIVEPSQGWGVRGDTHATLEMLDRYERETWFRLGDRDFATHIARTDLLAAGLPLSEVTDRLRRALGLPTRLLPMTDDPVGTQVRTPDGLLAFQEYFVHRRAEPEVLEIIYGGMAEARPAPGVLDAIASADALVISPSNPLVSVGTILAVPGLRDGLASRTRRVAISPIVAGGTIKGPADRMMRGLGLEVSAYGVAAFYRGLIDVIVIDQADAALAPRIRNELGTTVVVADTIMRDAEAKQHLARVVLEAVE